MWWLRQVRWPECLSLCLCIQRHMSDLVFNVLLLPWALCSWSCFFSQFPHPLSSSLSLPLFSSISADCSFHLPYGRLEYLDQIEYVRVTFCLSHHRGPPCFWGTFWSEGCRCACWALEKFLEFMLQTSDDLHTSFTNWMSQSVHFYIALL